jgi:uncharacterized protein YecT (DUF1311 family)
MRILALTFTLFAFPVAAQDLNFSPAGTEACLANAVEYEAKRACVGVSADQCMTNTPGGYSTYGMGGCLSAELEYWDAKLNAVYADVVAETRRSDAEMASLGANVASQEDALRAMQRAWITFRDATCDYEYSQWGGGTGGGPAIASCLMRMTGDQTLYLDYSRLGG